MRLIIAILLLVSNLTYGQLIKSNSAIVNNTINNNIVGFNPDLWLPDSIFIAQGNFIEIFNDNLAYIPAERKGRITFDWDCNIGVETTVSYQIKATNLGTHNLTVICYNSINNPIDTATTIIKIESKIALGNKTILAIGNSLTAGGWVYDRPQIDDSLNVTLTSVGTKGSDPNKCEGISGWTYAKFMGVLSPFYIGGKIDFNAYCTALPSYPDVIRVQLGINDCLFSILDGSITFTTLQGQITRMVDSLINSTTANIIICQPTTSSNTIYGAMYQLGEYWKYEPYILQMRELHKYIYTTFGNKIYNSRVYVSCEQLYIDRNDGYPKTSGIHNDLVHPDVSGHQNFIRGTLNVINHIYQ